MINQMMSLTTYKINALFLFLFLLRSLAMFRAKEYLGINNLLKCLILNMSNQQVWCTIASIAIQTRAFELCSKALIKLEAQDVSYLQMATPTF